MKVLITAVVVALAVGGYYYANRKKPALSPAPAATQTLAGVVKHVDVKAHKISVRDKSGKLVVLDVGSAPKISLEGSQKSASMSSMKVGQDVSVTLRGSDIESIQIASGAHKPMHVARAKRGAPKT